MPIDDPAINPTTSSPLSSLLHLEFAYQHRDFIQAKKELRKLHLGDRIFYMGSRLLIGILLTPVLSTLALGFLLSAYRLLFSPSSMTKEDVHLAVTLSIVALCTAIGTFVAIQDRRRKNRRLQKTIIFLDITPHGLMWRSPVSCIHLGWDYYRQLLETRDLFLLRGRNRSTTILPKRIMTPGQLLAARDILHARLCRTQAFPVLMENPLTRFLTP